MVSEVTPKVWRNDNEKGIIVLSEVIGVVTYNDSILHVYLKSGQHIYMKYGNNDKRDQIAKSLSDAVAEYHATSQYR